MSVYWRHDRRREALRRIAAGSADGLEALGRRVAERSNELAPRRSGLLAESVRVETAGDRRSVTISYSAPYAAKVHEDTTAKHRRGQAKFLERALQETVARMTGTIGRAIARRLS